jgi:hypothetical protein
VTNFKELSISAGSRVNPKTGEVLEIIEDESFS